MKTRTLVKVIHGSHLYGLATPTSDKDYYEVYDFYNQRYRPKKLAKQHIVDNEDVTSVYLERFISLCQKGVPQALETLYCEQDVWLEWDEDWPIQRGLIIGGMISCRDQVLDTYRRTIMNFWRGDLKKKRHALRLLLNAQQFADTEFIHPRLSQNQVNELNQILASWDAHEIYRDRLFQILP